MNFYPDSEHIVIVGNGIAGITAALEVCRLSPKNQVTIITAQNHPTIYNPALKQFALGKIAREHLLAYPAGTERINHIQMITARVEAIKARERRVYLSDGQAISYDSLLLATGSAPVGLAPSLPGRDFDGVLALHRLNDYLDLRRSFSEVKEAVVIGSGTHALGTVMSLLSRRIRVHWLLRGETCLSKMFDREASDVILEDCRRAGARVVTNCPVVGIVGKVGVVAGVVTNDNQMLACQLVIACTGSRAETTLAAQCDVSIKRQQGILVDEYFRTSAAHIFAAGDCAALKDPQTGTYHPRMQWHAAVVEGQIAAAVMTGQPEVAPAFGVPWHATQLGSRSMVSVGDPLSTSRGVTILTDRGKRSYRRVAFYDNQLIGYLSIGDVHPDSFAIRRLIDEGHSIRGIEKELLTGAFDGRQYFSQHRTSPPVSRRMITEKLSAMSLSERLPGAQDTESLLPITHVDAENNSRRILPAASIRSLQSLASKPPEPANWIIPELIPEGVSFMVDTQKVGVSWFNLALGLSVSGSTDADTGTTPMQHGNVLYLALEDNELQLHKRLEKLLVPGAAPSDDFAYATNWPRLNDDGLIALEEWVQAHARARLLLIDSWSKVKPLARGQTSDEKLHAEYEALARLKSLANARSLGIVEFLRAPRVYTPLRYRMKPMQERTQLTVLMDFYR